MRQLRVERGLSQAALAARLDISASYLNQIEHDVRPLTAAVLTDDDAWRLGFAQERGGLDTALELARRTVALAPLTQAGSKLGMGATPGPDADYAAAFARAWASDDLAEGQRAFGERRSPRFVGR